MLGACTGYLFGHSNKVLGQKASLRGRGKRVYVGAWFKDTGLRGRKVMMVAAGGSISSPRSRSGGEGGRHVYPVHPFCSPGPGPCIQDRSSHLRWPKAEHTSQASTVTWLLGDSRSH